MRPIIFEGPSATGLSQHGMPGRKDVGPKLKSDEATHAGYNATGMRADRDGGPVQQIGRERRRVADHRQVPCCGAKLLKTLLARPIGELPGIQKTSNDQSFIEPDYRSSP